jgi:hypothetical protein
MKLPQEPENPPAMNKEETIRYAVENISKPEVNYQVLLASTPEVAMDIVETLPGVKGLLAYEPEAEEVALNLLKTEGGTDADNKATIGLYLLHHIKTPQTTRELADVVANEQFKGINKELAASAFLRSADIDTDAENMVEVATQKAREYQNRE